VENEESGCPLPDPNKTMIMSLRSPETYTIKPPKKKSLRKSWRSYETCLSRMYKMHSRNFKTPKTQNMRRNRNK
jgi:hypothetical protein